MHIFNFQHILKTDKNKGTLATDIMRQWQSLNIPYQHKGAMNSIQLEAYR